jgi:hypothetical protein
MSAIHSAPQTGRSSVLPKRPLRVVKPGRRPPPRVPFVIVVSVVLVVGVVGLLVFNTSMQQASYTAKSLAQERDSLLIKEESLRVELEQLQRPQSIAEQAQSLGMVPKIDPTFLELPSGKIIGKLEPAVPADQQRILPLPEPKPAEIVPERRVETVIAEEPESKPNRRKKRERQGQNSRAGR